ncbi:MAG: hypothetical protein K6C08_00785 [Oscillospiraceae bacterium]|nr:hypothetical protein [Oscillospiraceae bacterium]
MKTEKHILSAALAGFVLLLGVCAPTLNAAGESATLLSAPVYAADVDNDTADCLTETSGMTLSEDSSGFVLLSDLVPDAILEIRYYSTFILWEIELTAMKNLWLS